MTLRRMFAEKGVARGEILRESVGSISSWFWHGLLLSRHMVQLHSDRSPITARSHDSSNKGTVDIIHMVVLARILCFVTGSLFCRLAARSPAGAVYVISIALSGRGVGVLRAPRSRNPRAGATGAPRKLKPGRCFGAGDSGCITIPSAGTHSPCKTSHHIPCRRSSRRFWLYLHSACWPGMIRGYPAQHFVFATS